MFDNIQFVMGVDPGYDKRTGYSIRELGVPGLSKVASGTFMEAVQAAITLNELSTGLVVVYMEDPNLDSVVFTKAKKNRKGPAGPHSSQEIKDNWQSFLKLALMPYLKKCFTQGRILPTGNLGKAYRVNLKIAQDIGRNKAIAYAIKSILTAHGIFVVSVAPSARHRANSPVRYRGKPIRGATIPVDQMNKPTKLNAKQFADRTKYLAKTNEHGRDAATLIDMLRPGTIKIDLTTQYGRLKDVMEGVQGFGIMGKNTNCK